MSKNLKAIGLLIRHLLLTPVALGIIVGGPIGVIIVEAVIYPKAACIIAGPMVVIAFGYYCTKKFKEIKSEL